MTALTTHTDLDALAAALTGRLVRAGDADYPAAATPWNVAIPPTAVAVVEARTAQDVVATVRYAAAHGFEVAVQATGHGAAHRVDETKPQLLINTAALDELSVDPLGSARIGAGVRWEAVTAASAPLGLGPLAGSAPGVGVAGYLTGGGLGPVARTFGVSSDLVTVFEVVTGDGELRRATPEENQSLFWGLRGGKGALGIVTAIETDLVAVREILGGCLFFAGEDAGRVLHCWSTWTSSLSDQASSSVAVMRLPPMPGVPEPLAGKVVVAVRFAWVGDPDEGLAVLAPMAAIGEPVMGGMGVMPYAALGSIHADPVDPMPATETSGLLRDLAPEAVDTLVALVGPDAECPQIIVELRHLGGAITRPPAHESAYGFRDAAYAVLLIGPGVPPVVDAARTHGAAVLDALAPWTAPGCLPNFGASNDPVQVARKYTPADLTRLAGLADLYDPSGVIAAAEPVRRAARLA